MFTTGVETELHAECAFLWREPYKAGRRRCESARYDGDGVRRQRHTDFSALLHDTIVADVAPEFLRLHRATPIRELKHALVSAT